MFFKLVIFRVNIHSYNLTSAGKPYYFAQSSAYPALIQKKTEPTATHVSLIHHRNAILSLFNWRTNIPLSQRWRCELPNGPVVKQSTVIFPKTSSCWCFILMIMPHIYNSFTAMLLCYSSISSRCWSDKIRILKRSFNPDGAHRNRTVYQPSLPISYAADPEIKVLFIIPGYLNTMLTI